MVGDGEIGAIDGILGDFVDEKTGAVVDGGFIPPFLLSFFMEPFLLIIFFMPFDPLLPFLLPFGPLDPFARLPFLLFLPLPLPIPILFFLASLDIFEERFGLLMDIIMSCLDEDESFEGRSLDMAPLLLIDGSFLITRPLPLLLA